MLCSTTVAIVFDVDDTLVYTCRTGYKKVHRLAQTEGLVSPSKSEFLLAYGTLDFAQCIRTWFGPQADVAKLMRFYDLLRTEIPYEPVAGSAKMITRLKSIGVRIGILTNGPASKTELKLRAASVCPNTLSAVVSLGNGTIRKPDLGCFNRSLELLECSPQDTIFVGDSISDAMAARNNGVQFAAVLTGCVTKKEFQALGVPDANIFDDISALGDSWFK